MKETRLCTYCRRAFIAREAAKVYCRATCSDTVGAMKRKLKRLDCYWEDDARIRKDLEVLCNTFPPPPISTLKGLVDLRDLGRQAENWAKRWIKEAKVAGPGQENYAQAYGFLERVKALCTQAALALKAQGKKARF